MSIFRVFFLDDKMNLWGETGYDIVAETGNEAAARLAVLHSVPIECTAHVYSITQVQLGGDIAHGGHNSGLFIGAGGLVLK